MARGKTLESLLTSLRAELGVSLNPAHNVSVRETQIERLQRVQETLWDDYNWPHLRVYRYLELTADQRYYDPDGCKKYIDGALVAAGDVQIDRILKMWVRDGSIWRPLDPGIHERNYNAYNSDTGEASWPPQRWQVSEDDQIEIWPIPGLSSDAANGTNLVRFHGVRNLADLIQDTDRADLDDRLITLMAAAEMLPDEKGRKKAGLAQRRLMKVLGNNTKQKRFRMFGRQEPRRILRGPPTVYYRTT
jgi:hypothetical protein